MRKIFALIFLMTFFLTSCKEISIESAQGAQSKKLGSCSTTKCPSDISLKENFPQPEIKVISIKTIYCRKGDNDGVPLTGYIDAVYSGNENESIHVIYGSPTWGVLKGFGYGATEGRGSFRYFPPPRPCFDSIPVLLMANNGIKKEVKLTVVVK